MKKEIFIIFCLIFLLLIITPIYAEELNKKDLAIFKNSNFLSEKERIREINNVISEKDLNWVAGKTSMSNFSQKERKSFLLQDRPEMSDEKIKKLTDLNSLKNYNYPSSIDWRNNNGNWITPIKSQGSCGSCWAFSVTGVIEAMINIALNNSDYDIDLSEQDLISCSNAGSCSGGNEGPALEYIKNNGIVKESCFPYTSINNSCSNKCVNQEPVGILDYNILTNPSDIKQAINDYGPVTVYMAVYEDFYDYSNGIYQWAYGDYLGLHAISIVGYNDVEEYWVSKNSWGTGWGESGFFRINYSENVLDFSNWNPTLIGEFFLDESYVVTSTDIDNDSIDDSLDNCPEISNLNQEDNDSDGVGNPCDLDNDNDGVLDSDDNCPFVVGLSCNNGCPDDIAPAIEIYSPLPTRYFTNNILINLALEDNHATSMNQQSCLDSVWMNYKGENITIETPYYQYYDFNFEENNIIFYANDTSGNIGSANMSFIINSSRVNLNCNNESVSHNCSALNSISSIDSLLINSTFYKNQEYNLKINWTGWHYYNTNYWAFFLNGSLAPLSICTSYNDDYNISNSYIMNCSLFIPKELSLGNFLLTITSNDHPGYCSPGEEGVDAEYSQEIYIDCFDNWTLNESWSECDINDAQHKNYYDLNECYKESILENEVQSCDFCTPNWTEVLTECQTDDSKIEWFNDTNSCYAQTNLSSDLENKPENITYNFVCDFDKDGFVGSALNINTTIKNLAVEETNNTFELKENNNTLVEFNLTNITIDLSNLFIEKQSNESVFAYLIIKGLDLTSQNQTKTIYFDKLFNGTGVCIKDAEIFSVNEISEACTMENETWLSCPDSNENYTCELANNNTRYKISGLKHSGVKEQETYCGDGSCNGGEGCSSCITDCGNCPSANTPGGGGGGGGSSSSKITIPKITNKTVTNQTIITLSNTTIDEAKTNIKSNDTKIEVDTQGWARITGAVVGNIKDKALPVIVFVVMILGATIIIYRFKAKSKS